MGPQFIDSAGKLVEVLAPATPSGDLQQDMTLLVLRAGGRKLLGSRVTETQDFSERVLQSVALLLIGAHAAAEVRAKTRVEADPTTHALIESMTKEQVRDRLSGTAAIAMVSELEALLEDLATPGVSVKPSARGGFQKWAGKLTQEFGVTLDALEAHYMERALLRRNEFGHQGTSRPGAKPYPLAAVEPNEVFAWAYVTVLVGSYAAAAR